MAKNEENDDMPEESQPPKKNRKKKDPDFDPSMEGIEILDDEEAEAERAQEAYELAEAERESDEVAINKATHGHLINMKARDRAKDRYRHEQEGDVPLPPSVTLADLLVADIREQWYIEGFLPEDGKCLLVSTAKGGKTTTVTNMIHSLLTQRPFLGKFPVNMDHPLRIALIDNEMSPAMLQRWYARLNLTEEESERLTIFRALGKTNSFDPTNPSNRERWATLLEPFDLVIIDCLAPFIVGAGLDENNEAGKWLTALDLLMDAAGIISYVVVHHTGHEGERARGDSRILGWPSQIINLTIEERFLDDPTPYRFIKTYGRTEPVPVGALDFDPETGLLDYLSGLTRAKVRESKDKRTSAEKKTETRMKLLQETYGYDNWFSAVEAAEVLGMTSRGFANWFKSTGIPSGRFDVNIGAGGRGGGTVLRLLPPMDVVDSSDD